MEKLIQTIKDKNAELLELENNLRPWCNKNNVELETKFNWVDNGNGRVCSNDEIHFLYKEIDQLNKQLHYEIFKEELVQERKKIQEIDIELTELTKIIDELNKKKDLLVKERHNLDTLICDNVGSKNFNLTGLAADILSGICILKDGKPTELESVPESSVVP